MSGISYTPVFVDKDAFGVNFSTNQKQFCAKMGIVNATSSNYNDLSNKPKINGVELIGDKTSQELNIYADKEFVWEQRVASDVWEITHGLHKFPSVTIVDSANSIIIGDVVYIDENNVRITFQSAFSGKVFFN